jgi:hypothetical protein
MFKDETRKKKSARKINTNEQKQIKNKKPMGVGLGQPTHLGLFIIFFSIFGGGFSKNNCRHCLL